MLKLMAKSKQSDKKTNSKKHFLLISVIIVSILLLCFISLQFLFKPDNNYGLDKLQNYLVENGFLDTEIFRNSCGNGGIKYGSTTCVDRLETKVSSTDGKYVEDQFNKLLELTSKQRFFALNFNIPEAMEDTSFGKRVQRDIKSTLNKRDCLLWTTYAKPDYSSELYRTSYRVICQLN